MESSTIYIYTDTLHYLYMVILTSNFYDSYSFTLCSWNHNIILYYKYDINICMYWSVMSSPLCWGSSWSWGSIKDLMVKIVVYHQDIKTCRVWSCCCVSRGRFILLTHEFCAATRSVSKCLYLCWDELWPQQHCVSELLLTGRTPHQRQADKLNEA